MAEMEEGFEYQGVFYRWRVSDVGKDLRLIDHFTKMPIQEFFEVVEDAIDRGRAPVMLALIATSMRAMHPDRSVERIIRTVDDLSLSDVEFIGGDEDAGIAPDVAIPNEDGQSPPPLTSDEHTNGTSSGEPSSPADAQPNHQETSEPAFESFSATLP